MIPRASRLNGSSQRPQERDRPGLGHPCTCLECGGPYTPRQRDAEFCSPGCRGAWNNRRAVRGAKLHDLAMAWRYDRPNATRQQVFTAMSRMIAEFRREDIAQRDGRRSWTPPARVIERQPSVRAQLLSSATGGRS